MEKKAKIGVNYIFERNVIVCAGACPTPTPKLHLRFLWNLMFCLNWFFMISQWLATFYQAYVFRSNLDILVPTLSYGVTHTAAAVKYATFLLKNKNLRQIEDILFSEDFAPKLGEQSFQVLQSNRWFRLLMYYYRTTCTAVVIAFLLQPFVFDAYLPLPGLYPVDMEEKYVQVYIYQFLALVFNAWTNSGIDTVCLSLMKVSGIKFDLLKDDLSNLHLSSETDVYLKQKIDQHLVILRFVELIEDLFTDAIFLQIFVSIGVICLTMFQLIANDPGPEFIMFLLYYVCMISQISMYCWLGEDVRVKSTELSDACYMSEWYECTLKAQKMIFLIMERAKRPSMFTAGKFIILSLATLVMIFRSAYSIVAVLRSIDE